MASFTGMFVNSWVGSIKPFYGAKERRKRWKDKMTGRKHIKVEDKTQANQIVSLRCALSFLSLNEF